VSSSLWSDPFFEPVNCWFLSTLAAAEEAKMGL